jgi:hypothetical protein
MTRSLDLHGFQRNASTLLNGRAPLFHFESKMQAGHPVFAQCVCAKAL